MRLAERVQAFNRFYFLQIRCNIIDKTCKKNIRQTLAKLIDKQSAGSQKAVSSYVIRCPAEKRLFVHYIAK